MIAFKKINSKFFFHGNWHSLVLLGLCEKIWVKSKINYKTLVCMKVSLPDSKSYGVIELIYKKSSFIVEWDIFGATKPFILLFLVIVSSHDS